jgi:hypothetical protein
MTRLDKIGTMVNMVPRPPDTSPRTLGVYVGADRQPDITSPPPQEEMAFFKKELPRLAKALKSYRAEFVKRKCRKQAAILEKALKLLASTL